MTASVAAGLALALASACALNWSYYAQHHAASGLPPLSVRHPLRSLRLLFANLRWLVGFVTGIGGWLLYVGAVALAPLSVVQAVSAAGIGVLALLVSRGGVALARAERAGVAAAILSLVLLGVSLAHDRTRSDNGSWPGVAIWLGASAVAAAVAAGPLARRLVPGAGLGLAAGLLYGAGDVATKAGVGGGAHTLFFLAMLACHGFAFVALQLGFQRGRALATAGTATLFTNALPIVAGMVLFHETLPGGALGALRVAAFALAIAGAAALTARGHPGDGGTTHGDATAADAANGPAAAPAT